MNVNTGDVICSDKDTLAKYLKENSLSQEDVVEVSESEMTNKQKERLEKGEQPVVSPNDNRSVLGQRRVSLAKQRRATKHARYQERKRKQREGNRKANGGR